MTTPEVPPDGDVVAQFEDLRRSLDQADLTPAVRDAVAQFDQGLRHHLRINALQLVRYQLLFDAAPDPYVVTDRDGHITEVNTAAADLLGSEHPEIVGKPLVDFVPPEHYERYFGWLRMLQAGTPEARWDTAVRAPGQRSAVPVEVCLADDLEGIGYRWSLRDQRERTAAERHLLDVAEREHQVADELRAESRVNTQFLRSLSHDLRGPIGALIHQSELLTSDGLKPEIRRRSRAAMEDNARLLRQILESLVDIERFAMGDLELCVARVSVADIVSTLHRSDQEDGVRVPTVDPSIVVEADREVLRRALLTVVNAVKASDVDRVDVEVRRVDATVQISVRGEGARPPAEDRIDLRLARTLLEMQGGSLNHLREDPGHIAVVSLPVSDGERR